MMIISVYYYRVGIPALAQGRQLGSSIDQPTPFLKKTKDTRRNESRSRFYFLIYNTQRNSHLIQINDCLIYIENTRRFGGQHELVIIKTATTTAGGAPTRNLARHIQIPI